MPSPAPHLLIVEAPYYRDISDALLDGAKAALAAAGATFDLVWVPGALEIPAAIAFAVKAGRYDGFVALGCIIRGETYHFDVVANESSRGLTELALRHGLAIGNGILTTEDEAQAWVRARVAEGDKGGFAAKTALHMIELRAKLGSGR